MAVSYSVPTGVSTYILKSNNFIIFHLIWYRVAHCLKNTEYGRHGLDYECGFVVLVYGTLITKGSASKNTRRDE